MAAYGNIQPVIWNEQERRCAVIQILCIKGNTISNTQVSELLGIDRRRVVELRQQLKDTRDPRAVVDRAFRPSSSARKARPPNSSGGCQTSSSTTPVGPSGMSPRSWTFLT
ncbi:Uncharacterized protein FKW44_008765 [Caligus rogercresseyi]|uniref:Uncharacterized protein n=1 Tax=Caligus rogercresseyi TaxID=217165 RepID=A0A7T8KGK9_CALRO|nr:Uncharacterized protein FKW44_008765 [Caligus rogercresseyi]